MFYFKHYFKIFTDFNSLKFSILKNNIWLIWIFAKFYFIGFGNPSPSLA